MSKLAKLWKRKAKSSTWLLNHSAEMMDEFQERTEEAEKTVFKLNAALSVAAEDIENDLFVLSFSEEMGQEEKERLHNKLLRRYKAIQTALLPESNEQWVGVSWKNEADFANAGWNSEISKRLELEQENKELKKRLLETQHLYYMEQTRNTLLLTEGCKHYTIGVSDSSKPLPGFDKDEK